MNFCCVILFFFFSRCMTIQGSHVPFSEIIVWAFLSEKNPERCFCSLRVDMRLCLLLSVASREKEKEKKESRQQKKFICLQPPCFEPPTGVSSSFLMRESQGTLEEEIELLWMLFLPSSFLFSFQNLLLPSLSVEVKNIPKQGLSFLLKIHWKNGIHEAEKNLQEKTFHSLFSATIKKSDASQ